MITTIQLSEETKNALERAKEKSSETYEEVIKMLLQQVEKQKREQEQLMIEECTEMSEEYLKITKEWETTDATLNGDW
ncbi:MAG TPA: hypothetical protein VJJ79_02845 [Candidatus Nanoarchaeia archaeon]|nr:hypothetical protein [Candidatus Nanoarchaeia archaeon]